MYGSLYWPLEDLWLKFKKKKTTQWSEWLLHTVSPVTLNNNWFTNPVNLLAVEYPSALVVNEWEVVVAVSVWLSVSLLQA